MLSGLHPIAVHFPIALLLTALLAQGIWLWKRMPVFVEMGFWLLLLGAVAAAVAALTGGWAEDAATVSKEVAAEIAQHETTAYITVWIYAVLAVWQLLRKAKMEMAEHRMYFGALLVASAILIYTAYQGGVLVYDYGVGVNIQTP